jgi:hypothetical protein
LDGESLYGFPAGGDLKRSMAALEAHCAAAGETLRLGLLSARMKEAH